MAPLEVDEARRLLLAEVRPTTPETVPLERCLGRVTAVPLSAATPPPPFDNSAMDGFAVRSADLAEGPRSLRIVAESRAGSPATVALGPDEAARISTGAAIPAGADAVVPVEEAREEGDAGTPTCGTAAAGGTVIPTAGAVVAGAHVRRAGEDLAAGEEALPAAAEIGPAEIGVLASLGLAEVACAARPTLAVLTSGDELVDPGAPPGPGQIVDSNRFTLLASAERAGAAARFAGRLPDQPEPTRAAIAAALDADLVVIAGGVSVGRHDHVKGALAELGVDQLFWRLALCPGGPTWGGVMRRRPDGRPTLVLGLPGNPVSAMVTFRLFVQPLILAACGHDPEQTRATMPLAEAYAKPPGRAHYLRCRLEPGPGGLRAVLTRERQGSHVLSSMLGAECLAVIPAAIAGVAAGEPVEVLLL